MSVPAETTGPRLLLLAGGIALVQAATLIALAVLDITHLVADRASLGVGIAVMLFVFGGGLAVAAVAVMRGRHGGRGPVLVAQLISLGLAWNLRDAGEDVVRGVSPVLALAALIVLGCLFSGPGRRAMSRDEPA